MSWTIAALLALIAAAVLMRLRYGTLRDRITDLFERLFGVKLSTVLGAVGILTLVVWFAIYLMAEDDEQTGLGEIFPKFYQNAPGQEPPGDQ